MPEQETKKDNTLDKVVAKIKDAENVLVALSDNPTVDEMAAAIGLTMALDSAGKHATAIYSGETPNVLEFLNPQETFETNTNSLQDFIIALNKEKADHLRYKVDGDFVKVYITPYRTTISEDDLEFSRGDFNVDLVVALNVAAATDLDGALKEHGRIMHDASAVNITLGPPGKFGEVEWADTEASSISEMVTNLALRLSKDLDKGTATALLTGLVAATDRFSNEKTTPAAMVLAAKLMGAGADQQVIAANIAGKVDFNERAGGSEAPKETEEDKSKISIDHSPKKEEATEEGEAPAELKTSSEELSAGAVPQSPEIKGVSEGAGAAGVPEGGAVSTMPQTENFTGINMPPSLADQMVQQIQDGGEVTGASETGAVETPGAPVEASTGAETGEVSAGAIAKDYGKMIDEALAEPLPGEGGIQVGAMGAAGAVSNTQEVSQINNPAAMSAPGVGTEPAVNNIPDINYGEMGNSAEGGSSYIVSQPEKVLNPENAQPVPNIEDLVKKELTVGAGPTVGEPGMENVAQSEATENPAMEPVPVPSDLPMPGQEILPPPPTPPVDFSMDSQQPEAPAVPEMPQVQVEVPEVEAPENSSAVVQPDNTPGAFQIPGM